MRIVGAFNRPTRGQNLSTEEAKALAGLRKDSSIVILSSDKGRSTVVLDKSEYEFKAVTLLQNTNTYEVVNVDPTPKLQLKVEGELKKLKESRVISEREWMVMKPGDSVLPEMYGLPKIHKKGVPLRPISAFRGSPTYNLAKVLAKTTKALGGEDLLKQAALSKIEGSEEFRDNEKLSTEELVSLVNLCLDSTFFSFREKV
ncbi:uncharacterized protein LOC143018097 [Oratosquilla oratoria]|uniref:uncharacterized protein LOC143018097 n=1 Tax=Oratosquilla oratoria TaxID=337810 RepID=UPI003F7709BF